MNKLVKVCGMGQAENVSAISELPLDLMGFIFYDKSPRRVDETIFKYIDDSPFKKVGVFVNEALEVVLEKAKAYQLDLIQLHGFESPDYCQEVRKQLPVIKAIGISQVQDFELCMHYYSAVDYFLFDTKSKQYGGTGQQFNWDVLQAYKGTVPFLLAGGITVKDVSTLKQINHPQLIGFDINSGFELEPGLKNVSLVNQFIADISS